MGFQPKVLPYAYEIKTIDSHTMGESTRIVYDGFPYLPGDTMMEKKKYFKETSPSEITDIDTLVKGDYKIAVEKGTASHLYCTNNGVSDDRLEVHDTITTAYESLVQGKVDAVIQDGPNAYYYIKTTDGTKLEVVGILLGFLLGALAGFALQTKCCIARAVAGVYIWIIRATPLIVQALYV